MLPFHLFGKNNAMWSDDNVGNNRLTSSSSSSSSRFTNPKKTMEDVWKDISLNTLQGRSNKSREEMEPKGSFRRMLLQEFLARPFREQQQQRSSEAPDQHTEMNMSPFGGASDPPPATILSLNSSPDQFHYLDSVGLGTNPLRLQPHHCCGGGSNPPSFMDPSPPSNTFEAIGSSFCKKRVPESLDSSGDRRHKRMIKNRESAARSRARKQVYSTFTILAMFSLCGSEFGRLLLKCCFLSAGLH